MPTTETFWNQMGAYNEATLPVQIVVMIAAAIPKVDKKVYIFLLPWAIMSLPKCLGALDCYEDCILFTAGVYGLVLLVRNWKVIGMSHRDE